MNLEIHNPELLQSVNAHIQTGHFHHADELLEKALEGKASALSPAAGRRRAACPAALLSR